MTTPKIPIGIRKIEITNFRNIEHLKLDFTGADDGPSEIVVIAGPNGCGKTAVLEACLLALGNYRMATYGNSHHPDIRFGRIAWIVNAEILNKDRYENIDLYSHLIGDGTNLDRLIASGSVPYYYFRSGRTQKLIGPLSITSGTNGKPPEDIDENRIWRIKQHFINAKAHALMASGTPAVEPEYARKLAKLNSNWALFHHEKGYEFVVEPVDANPDSGFDLFLKSPDGVKLSVDRLSSGQLELLGFFGGLLMIGFDEGVVVIDEPELHLDPQWHGLLMLAIQRLLPKVQLIVATHSTRIYDSVYSFQRYFLVPENDPRAAAWRSEQPVQELAAV